MPESHRDYFNRLAQEWDRMMPPEPRFRDWLVRFDVRSGDRILDIGAGTGRVAEVLSELTGPSGTVFVADLAKAMLVEAKARRCGPGLIFACLDAHRLPMRTSCLDKIVCYSALPHFADKPGALREFARVLLPGGRLLVLHSGSHASLNAFHASLEGPVRGDRLPGPEAIERLFARAGLVPVRCEESEDLYWAEAKRKD
jgi:ubiquinone/menaquinone biosynthesis C-methylase UbiE